MDPSFLLSLFLGAASVGGGMYADDGPDR